MVADEMTATPEEEEEEGDEGEVVIITAETVPSTTPLGLIGRRLGGVGLVEGAVRKEAAVPVETKVAKEAEEEEEEAAASAGTPLTVNLSPTSLVYLMFVYSRPAWALFCSERKEKRS